jgi:class 3 adenylate cyclase/CHASE2 domain-containing sensor protein
MNIASENFRRTGNALFLAGLAVALVATSLLAVNFVAPLRQTAQWIDDLRLAYLVPPVEQSPDVVVLAIDEQSMRDFPYRSPVDRGYLAGLVRHLATVHRPKAIGIDMIFDQPTDPAKDEELRSILVQSPVPVVVAGGETQTGLNPAQIEYQAKFLDGIATGSAILGVEDGVVRNYFPHSPVSGATSFVHALANSAGVRSTLEPAPILYRRVAIDNAKPLRVFPAHSIGLLPADWLKDRFVLLGVDLADRDQHRTPLSILGADHEFMPGVLIHAQTLAQLLSGASIPQISGAYETAIILTAVLLGLLLALAPLPSALRITAALLTCTTYLAAAFSTGVYVSTPLPVLGPLLGFALATSIATSHARQQERRRRKFLRGAFNQYVSTEIIEDILAHPEHLEPGGELRDMSFIFTDIAGFSGLAERLEPTALVEILTDYLDGVVDIALKNKGTIARFVGDGLVIFFSAPVPDSQHRDHALQCALDIDDFCEQYRQKHQRPNCGLGVTRIGVNSGMAVVGNVGGRRRFEYTAHGDAVNTAARLEGANRHFGTRICISASTIDPLRLSDFRPIGRVIVKGRSTPLELYTSWDDMEPADRNSVLDAWRTLPQGNPLALAALTTLASRRPADRLLQLQLERLQSGRTDITFELTEK